MDKDSQDKAELIKMAKEQPMNHKRAMDAFYKKHYFNNSDPLSIILKTHLYIENCLNEILKINLPFPECLLDKTFSQKLDIFEAMNLWFPPGDSLIQKKLRLINKIRNAFAHNLDKEILDVEIRELAEGMSGARHAKSVNTLKSTLIHIVSYLHGLMVVNQFFPFLNSYLRNEKIFKKDVLWSDALIAFYPRSEIKEVMRALRM